MTIKNITINTVITIALLISHSYAWNMERNSLVTKKYLKEFYRVDTKKDRLQYTINSGLLGTLPSETLNIIISKISSLGDKIQTISSLSRTCKKISKLSLHYVNIMCLPHNDNEGWALLNTIANNKVNYWKKRTPFLMLLQITNTKPFLNELEKSTANFYYKLIMQNNDIEAVEILNFKPEKAYEILHLAQTPEMAQKLFNISKVDLQDPKNTDILWNMFFYKNEKALEMIKFYIKNNIPLNTINIKTGNSLLHTFIGNMCHIKGFEDKAIKAIELIIDACPELVNVTNHQGKTPIIIALKHISAILIKTHDALLSSNEICVGDVRLCNNILDALNKQADL